MSKIATVVGGSGFVGRHVVRALADAGYTVNVLCRDTIAAEPLKTAGNVGQIVLQYADITRPDTLTGKFAGSEVVINLVSTLVSRGRQSFKALNVDGATRVAVEAKAAGARTFVQFSALGIEQADDAQYGRTKKQGEAAVRTVFPDAIIFRPSLMFGPGDGFFDRFARMSVRSPFLPLIGGGLTKFQPVYVVDAAQAVVAALASEDAPGKTFELAGPDIYTFGQLLLLIMQTTGRDRNFITVPTPIASLMGVLGQCLPSPPITCDQVRMLRHDSIATGMPGLAALGVEPTTLVSQLPQLLTRYIAR